MDSAAVTRWLDIVMVESNVTGALLVDSSTGLCLGARGKATEQDAAYISIAARGALDSKGIGAVRYKDSKVLLRKGTTSILIAVFKEMDMRMSTGGGAGSSGTTAGHDSLDEMQDEL